MATFLGFFVLLELKVHQSSLTPVLGLPARAELSSRPSKILLSAVPFFCTHLPGKTPQCPRRHQLSFSSLLQAGHVFGGGMCVCRLLLWRGCNPRLRQTLQVVEPRTPVRTPPRASDPARLEVRGWRSWRLEEQDTQEGVTGVDQQLVAELAREGWGRGSRARAPKSALRNYPVPLLAPASRPRGRCKVAHNISQKPCKFGPKHSVAEQT